MRFLSGTSAMDRQCVDIAIINDDCKEENESFVFSIGAGGDASVHINDFHADVYIIDDEGTIYVSVVAFPINHLCDHSCTGVPVSWEWW